MKNIDWNGIGLGIFIACWGVSVVIDSIGDNQREADCQARGGNIVSNEKWIRERKQCVIPPVDRRATNAGK